jgi:small subunit ribosomal protein S11
MAQATKSRKKIIRSVPTGTMHILATFNNTIVTFADPKGKVLSWSSAGSCGFRGSRKGTAYAAQIASERAAEAAKPYGINTVDVYVKGIGLGREAAIRALQQFKISASSIKDVTGIPHNGCRSRKPRRI